MKIMKKNIVTVTENVKKVLLKKHKGINGIIVTLFLCLIAIVACETLGVSLDDFITTFCSAFVTKGKAMLGI